MSHSKQYLNFKILSNKICKKKRCMMHTVIVDHVVRFMFNVFLKMQFYKNYAFINSGVQI